MIAKTFFPKFCYNNFLDLMIRMLIAVIRCKDLNRQNGGNINAYVKVRRHKSRALRRSI